jgi:hypothetical protein
MVRALERQRDVDAAADAVLLALNHHGAVEPPFQIGVLVFLNDSMDNVRAKRITAKLKTKAVGG